MAQLLVRDLETETVAKLKERAALNHRSLQAEIRLILEEAAEAAAWQKEADEERRRHRAATLAFAQALTEKIRKEGRPQSDSTEFIRDVREHGHDFDPD